MGESIDTNQALSHSYALYQLQNSIGEITHVQCEPNDCDLKKNLDMNTGNSLDISSKSEPHNNIHIQNDSHQENVITSPNNDGNADAERMINAALLLTSVAEIASKEVLPGNRTTSQNTLKRKVSCSESPSTLVCPTHSMATASCPQSPPLLTIAPRISEFDSLTNSSYKHISSDDQQRQVCQFDAIISRKRFLPGHTSLPLLEHRDHSLSHVSITPPESPSQRPRTISTSSEDHFLAYGNAPLQPHDATARVLRYQKIKTILRKKFSWKNYPELEAFLIANREEYLRHSTLNYTVQQKQYNNKLTERMIELASEHGYIFDEDDFSFVTVRDRIRCYYKSYVQSLKKRGMIIGYAARKAGLVTEKELEQSAATAGKIIVP